MYLGLLAAIFGILFILGGISGLIPGFFIHGFLFGLFDVDQIHSVINFVIGFIALIAALNYKNARLFFQIFGIIFGVIAIAGFVWQGEFHFTHFNTADNIVHLVLAIIFLALGFSAKKQGKV